AGNTSCAGSGAASRPSSRGTRHRPAGCRPWGREDSRPRPGRRGRTRSPLTSSISFTGRAAPPDLLSSPGELERPDGFFLEVEGLHPAVQAEFLEEGPERSVEGKQPDVPAEGGSLAVEGEESTPAGTIDLANLVEAKGDLHSGA